MRPQFVGGTCLLTALTAVRHFPGINRADRVTSSYYRRQAARHDVIGQDVSGSHRDPSQLSVSPCKTETTGLELDVSAFFTSQEVDGSSGILSQHFSDNLACLRLD